MSMLDILSENSLNIIEMTPKGMSQQLDLILYLKVFLNYVLYDYTDQLMQNMNDLK